MYARIIQRCLFWTRIKIFVARNHVTDATSVQIQSQQHPENARINRAFPHGDLAFIRRTDLL